MTDAREMPWSEHRQVLQKWKDIADEAIPECDPQAYDRFQQAIDAALALGDRCQEAEQQDVKEEICRECWYLQHGWWPGEAPREPDDLRDAAETSDRNAKCKKHSQGEDRLEQAEAEVARLR